MVNPTDDSSVRPTVFDAEWRERNQLMTIKQVMELAQTSRTTINRLVESGDLEAVPFGKIRKIRCESVHNYLKRRSSKGGKESPRLMPRRYGPSSRQRRGEAA